MNHEEMERAIEFLLEQDARFNEAINRVKESIDRLTATQEKTSANIQGLTEAQVKTTEDQGKITNDLHLLTGKVLDLAEIVARFEEQAEADRRDMHESIGSLREEMRDGFNKLILANEVTRDLAQNVARLAIATS